MRTTVNIHDGLLETAKRCAQQQGKTLGDVVEEALQRYLTSAAPEPVAGPPLAIYDGPLGVKPGIDLRTNAGLYDVLYDEEDDLARRMARGEYP
ncbi:type II toxin-antitoxin system VapB family antitoxin [Nocardioides pelophilus]|uniref:type II toxin-antitoxin system VapB family antitoxin n=1 Tax=Nocardioides pelophilus TaxID=2172019 RepID=UPI0016046E0D|nr:type II toxin-antitoxin system VapB family antitoxin [Nocardioides pelophilus]